MKSLKSFAFSALLALGAFATITYTSCTKDECEDVVCNNGGSCSGGICACPTGYEGVQCDDLSREKFIGVYTGNETCTIGTDAYTLTITSNSDQLKVNLTNIYNSNFSAVATVTGTNSIAFSNSQSGATFNGTATVSGNTIVVEYTISDGTVSNTCTFTGNK